MQPVTENFRNRQAQYTIQQKQQDDYKEKYPGFKAVDPRAPLTSDEGYSAELEQGLGHEQGGVMQHPLLNTQQQDGVPPEQQVDASRSQHANEKQLQLLNEKRLQKQNEASMSMKP